MKWSFFLLSLGMLGQIEQPLKSTNIDVGESIYLVGTGNKISWNISKIDGPFTPIKIFGAKPEPITIWESGLFKVAMHADGIQDHRFLMIQARDDNFSPSIYQEGLDRRFLLRGTQETFVVDISDFEEEPIRVFWFQDGDLIAEKTDETEFIIDFSDPLISNPQEFLIEGVAVDSNGQPSDEIAQYRVFVYENQLPILPKINGFDQDHTVYLPIGSVYTIASDIDPQGLNLLWTLQYYDQDEPLLSTQNFVIPPVTLDRLGVLEVSFLAETQSVPAPEAQRLWLYVFDPNASPNATLTDPSRSSFTMEVDGSIRLGGFINDPNFFPPLNPSHTFTPPDVYTQWIINSPSGLNLTLESIEYDIAFSLGSIGTYRLSMSTYNEQLGTADDEPDKILIHTVEKAQTDNFEPNNSREQAATLGDGRYSSLILNDEDPEDWFVLAVENEGQTILLDLDLTDSGPIPVEASVYLGERLIHSETIVGGSIYPFSFISGPPGEYFIRCALPENRKRADGLSFGLGVRQVIPRMIFSEVRSDDFFESNLVLQNPNSHQIAFTLEARSKSGKVLGQFQGSLQAMQQMEQGVTAWFPKADQAQIAWVRVLSDGSLNGVSYALAKNGQSAYAEQASIGPSNELFIPHIAQDRQTWYTQITAVNVGGENLTPNLATPAENLIIQGMSSSYQNRRFRADDIKDGQPVVGEWGRISDSGLESVWAGVEIFGRVDGPEQTASLELSSTRQKNPNFFYIGQNIYFPHIAKDTQSFWSGLAFVNMSESQASIRLDGFDDQGNSVVSKAIQLDGNEKMVGLADQILELTQGQQVSWIELETSTSIIGYELFGSASNDNRLAGLNAVRGSSKMLDFPLAWQGDRWTGVALVNVSEVANTGSIVGYSSSGQKLAEAPLQLGPRQKRVFLVSELFQGFDIAWIRVEAHEPLAGFELLGDNLGNWMMGFTIQ